MPKKKPVRKTVVTPVSMTPELHQKMEARRKELGLSRSGYIQLLVSQAETQARRDEWEQNEIAKLRIAKKAGLK